MTLLKEHMGIHRKDPNIECESHGRFNGEIHDLKNYTGPVQKERARQRK
jgi:hypothetical protein